IQILSWRCLQGGNESKQVLMEKEPKPAAAEKASYGRRFKWSWFVAGGCLIVVLLAIVFPRHSTRPTNFASATNDLSKAARNNERPAPFGSFNQLQPSRSPEEIVADKVTQFAGDRRRIAHAMAKRFKVDLPPEVDQFFEAVGAGRWTEHNALFEKI